MNKKPLEIKGSKDARQPSSRQVAANQRNARRSTGPRTAAGKSRSSRNAFKHGIYASTAVAIELGPLAEDPQEVDELLEAFVLDLAPRDSHEEACATEIALLLLKQRRLAALQSAHENTIAESDEPTLRDVQDEQLLTLIESWVDSVLHANEPAASYADPIAAHEWAVMALYLRESTGRKLKVRGRWDDEVEPTTSEEWQLVFQALAKHLFPTSAELREWSTPLFRALVRQQKLRYETVIKRLLSEVDAFSTRAARLSAELNRKYMLYWVLQQRELSGA